MKITIDKYSGFCFGVVYAIQMAEEELAKSGKLYCLGDIVHNNMEVDRLNNLGVLPPFDEDDRITSFNNQREFQNWLSKFKPETNKLLNKAIFNDYFYKNDGNASKRFWEFIVNRLI